MMKDFIMLIFFLLMACINLWGIDYIFNAL